eukprot:Tbor_TRINITY_DN5578_c0_g1::TRINITY_DN5578_c0_g1_i6::g.13688::m.13688
MQAGVMEAQGHLFTEHVLKTLKSIIEGRKIDTNTCAYNDPLRKLTTHYYSQRIRKKGEHTTLEMYQAVRDVVRETEDKNKSSSAFLWHFSTGLPTVLSNLPITFDQDHILNISMPFGKWHSVFYPLNKLVTYNKEGHIPSLFNFPQIVEAAPPLFVGVFPGGLVKSGYGVTCNGHLLSAGGCLWRNIYVSHPKEKLPSIHESEIIIPLCDTWCRGYYHFTHEHLPRLALVHVLLTHPDSNALLVLPNKPSYFVKQFLFDVLGIPTKNVVWTYSIYRGELLVIPCKVYVSYSLHRKLFKTFFNVILYFFSSHSEIYFYTGKWKDFML